ncbi:MAG: hypothetical protein M0Q95_11245 [Porticoccaceae bacterium]|nr:hypothetical protein [Porticoccaceae bacterium]
MKISEMIFALEQIQKEHGDLDVETLCWDNRRIEARPPRVDYRAILTPRESKARFASYFGSEESRKGDKVCRL